LIIDTTTPPDHPVKQPIGVFDSGVGGLSVLRALRAELPHEDFVYVADTGFAPYGERDPGFVLQRARAIAHHLLTRKQGPIKALVIACNTATAAAIQVLRQDHPGLPIIGVEPALKPAIAVSKTGQIAVMATRGTLGSDKFRTLLASLVGDAHFVCQPCDGLADAIEHQDTSKVIALSQEYIRAMGRFGHEDGEIDTLVLGCTHYPFIARELLTLVAPGVQLVDNGEPVARQTRRVLRSLANVDRMGQLWLESTGRGETLAQAAQSWLGWRGSVQSLPI